MGKMTQLVMIVMIKRSKLLAKMYRVILQLMVKWISKTKSEYMLRNN